VEVALLEAVTGRFMNGDPVGDFGGAEMRVHSVVDSVTRLFNTRRGTVPYDPDYGLPDIGEVYQGLPNTVQGFKRVLTEAVRRYEPRIDAADCRVEQVSTDEFRLQATLAIRLVDGHSVRLRASFSSAGRAEVAPAVRRG
jgi:type VI secretion system protein